MIYIVTVIKRSVCFFPFNLRYRNCSADFLAMYYKFMVYDLLDEAQFHLHWGLSWTHASGRQWFSLTCIFRALLFALFIFAKIFWLLVQGLIQNLMMKIFWPATLYHFPSFDLFNQKVFFVTFLEKKRISSLSKHS